VTTLTIAAPDSEAAQILTLPLQAPLVQIAVLTTALFGLGR
jgi:hypothetical protein